MNASVPLTLPTRRESIAAAKSRGARVAAVLPIHYPRPLLVAHGLHPVEVWGPPGIDGGRAGAHLQAYTCAIVRNAAAFLLDGGLDEAQLLFIPHACDALQGMGSVVRDFIRPRQHVLTFYPPRGQRPADLAYLEAELRRIGRELAELSGTSATMVALHAAIDAEEEADVVVDALWRDRADIALTDRDFIALLRTREYLPSQAFIELTRTAPRGPSPARGVPLLLSGIVPEPKDLLDSLAEHGAHVAAEDLACLGRRRYAAASDPDPYLRLAQRLASGPPDWARGVSLRERGDHLIATARGAGARGVLFWSVKFCEPELFDIPRLRERLVAAGLRVLHVEHDLSRALSGQSTTRLAAFVEMLS